MNYLSYYLLQWKITFHKSCQIPNNSTKSDTFKTKLMTVCWFQLDCYQTLESAKMSVTASHILQFKICTTVTAVQGFLMYIFETDKYVQN